MCLFGNVWNNCYSSWVWIVFPQINHFINMDHFSNISLYHILFTIFSSWKFNHRSRTVHFQGGSGLGVFIQRVHLVPWHKRRLKYRYCIFLVILPEKLAWQWQIYDIWYYFDICSSKTALWFGFLPFHGFNRFAAGKTCLFQWMMWSLGNWCKYV